MKKSNWKPISKGFKIIMLILFTSFIFYSCLSEEDVKRHHINQSLIGEKVDFCGDTLMIIKAYYREVQLSNGTWINNKVLDKTLIK